MDDVNLRRLFTVLGTALAASAAGATLLCAAAAATELAPRPMCATPLPGSSSCLGERLERVGAGTPGAFPATRLLARRENLQAGPAGGLTPGDLVTAYGLTNASSQPSTQTVAIVDAYGDSTIQTDLGTFDTQYSLPACTTGNGCLKVVNEYGLTTNLPGQPPADDDWTAETSLDVETVHGICPNCKILLVQAATPSDTDLDMAENTAAQSSGVSVVSNSWGGSEPDTPDSALQHPGVVIAAATGDDGYLDWDLGGSGGPDYPATSPYVVSVGGTSLQLNTDGSYAGESVWNNDGGCDPQNGTGCRGATGGGCSTTFPAPQWQTSNPGWAATGCSGQRAAADVSADADPETGLDVVDSSLPQNNCNGSFCWQTVGGTSLATPIIAAVFALAGGAHGISYPAQTLYAEQQASPGSLHDVTSGGNAPATGTSTACNAATGYDAPTGVGTPNGIAAFQPVGGEISQTPQGGTSTGSGPSCGVGNGGGGGGAGGGGSGGHSAPSAHISAVSGAVAGALVTFSGSTSTASGATIAGYSWTFGDGATASGAVVGHTYATAGTYMVTLTVTDSLGFNSQPTTEWVTVSAAAAPAHLAVSGGVAVKAARGRVTVALGRTLVCGSQACSATTTLRATVHGHAVVIGSASAGAQGGHSTTLALTLNAAGLKDLARLRALHTNADVQLSGGGDVHFTFVTRAPRTLKKS
jgi:hypothetical protein